MVHMTTSPEMDTVCAYCEATAARVVEGVTVCADATCARTAERDHRRENPTPLAELLERYKRDDR